MMSNLAVQTNNLCKTFDGKEVVRNCSMHVERGTIYGFVGKNGAGKTTVFKMLLGLLKPTLGTVEILGKDSVRDNQDILSGTGSLIETPVFYEHLSAYENLEMHLEYMGIHKDVKRQLSMDDSILRALESVGLAGAGKQPVSTFSLGMRQRLGIARALIHRPEVLILDEPVNGLDPVGIREMRELFLKLVQEEGITILLSSHILSEIEQIADRIGVISDGALIEEANNQYGSIYDIVLSDVCKICCRRVYWKKGDSPIFLPVETPEYLESEDGDGVLLYSFGYGIVWHCCFRDFLSDRECNAFMQ